MKILNPLSQSNSLMILFLGWNTCVCVLVINDYVKLQIWGFPGTLQMCTTAFYTLNMKCGVFRFYFLFNLRWRGFSTSSFFLYIFGTEEFFVIVVLFLFLWIVYFVLFFKIVIRAKMVFILSHTKMTYP